jgi:hypothetical protein
MRVQIINNKKNQQTIKLQSCNIFGLEHKVSKEIDLSQLIAQTSFILSKNQPCILLPKPIEVSVTSGIGEEGDSLNFTVIAHESIIPNLSPKEIYSIHINNQLFHMQDYLFELPLFGLISREYRVKSNKIENYNKQSNIICLPPHICKVLYEIIHTKIKITDQLLDNLEVLLYEEFEKSVSHPKVFNKNLSNRFCVEKISQYMN